MSGGNLTRVYTAELEGIAAQLVEVEVDLQPGLHAFTIVGLADKAVNEARDRVNSAMKHVGVKPPNRENRRITVNLAPAHVKKAGVHYDVPIAVAYLLATGQLAPSDTSDKIFLGELSLDGRIRPVRGALNIAEMAAARGFHFVFVPTDNAREASAVRSISVIPISSIQELIDHLEGRRVVAPLEPHSLAQEPLSVPDFGEIRGQQSAKRAMTIAAAGGHNLLMVGPPGVGKSMLASAMTGILPELSLDEAIEVTKIYSAAGLNHRGSLFSSRPFRSPHHTASIPSIVGGTENPRPGEASLAHRGVLFLDELPEFSKSVLESLRQPMESGTIQVARAKFSAVFPAKFMLVAAMNPCPCGYYGDLEKECRCAAYEVIRYQKKVSGPLLDRIDLQIRLGRVAIDDLRSSNQSTTTAESVAVREQVRMARQTQAERFRSAGFPIHTNSEMSARQTEKLISLTPEAERFVSSLTKANLSPRSFYRLLKTARTIADIDRSDSVEASHLAEAFSYRLKEEA